MSKYAAKQNLLNDKIILVTGAGDGIGAAVSYDLAAYGATVILLGKTQKKLDIVYDKIEQAGFSQPAIYPLDLQMAKTSDYQLLANTIENEFGRLDGLIHNAAVLGTLTPLEHFDVKLWTNVIQVNINAPFLLSKYCLGLLKKSDDASVLFTSANVGFKGQAYWGAYAVSKAANENMMEILSEELEENTNIRVNSIDPGQVHTRINALAYPGEDTKNLPRPADITSVYLYLMGEESKGITGERFPAQD